MRKCLLCSDCFALLMELLKSPLPHLLFHSGTQLVPCYHGHTVDTLPHLSLLDDSEVTITDQREASGIGKYTATITVVSE